MSEKIDTLTQVATIIANDLRDSWGRRVVGTRAADLLEALAAERDAAKAKLAEAELERDEAKQVRSLHSMFDKSSRWYH